MYLAGNALFAGGLRLVSWFEGTTTMGAGSAPLRGPVASGVLSAIGCGLPLLTAVVAIGAWTRRRGPLETWVVDDASLVIEPSDPAQRTLSYPFAAIDLIRVAGGAPRSPTVELLLRVSATVERRIIARLDPINVTRIVEAMRERCAAHRAEGTLDPVIATRVTMSSAFVPGHVRIACPACRADRPIEAAWEPCACGQHGWDADAAIVPIRSWGHANSGWPMPGKGTRFPFALEVVHASVLNGWLIVPLIVAAWSVILKTLLEDDLHPCSIAVAGLLGVVTIVAIVLLVRRRDTALFVRNADGAFLIDPHRRVDLPAGTRIGVGRFVHAIVTPTSTMPIMASRAAAERIGELLRRG